MIEYFNSQPHEEADNGRTETTCDYAHFNSQPHEEADMILALVFSASRIISTHSLTKRLTQTTGLRESLILISTHSLTKRLTAIHNAENLSRTYFNSQPHEEADQKLSAVC